MFMCDRQLTAFSATVLVFGKRGQAKKSWPLRCSRETSVSSFVMGCYWPPCHALARPSLKHPVLERLLRHRQLSHRFRRD